ncbi:hypothetical protein POSPLADRAFT_1057562 [Postia placenta MAD-698-R-SB12]|uniref:DUF4050 domain-containing protein n=1 Tax=Postia placenta MAD-698-R-SB12 TaxID=670580 RepID=A0A1X6MZL1_9APHY|nr:hypothetical protein POSPLADRAFT_1057562 [Postia placenta MAD-698-R-SB12]OSX61797.1 hypothetical protein POSPLADRAFT_1057562 [Postia placenta MAD-698-R-SB12]
MPSLKQSPGKRPVRTAYCQNAHLRRRLQAAESRASAGSSSPPSTAAWMEQGIADITARMSAVVTDDSDVAMTTDVDFLPNQRDNSRGNAAASSATSPSPQRIHKDVMQSELRVECYRIASITTGRSPKPAEPDGFVSPPRFKAFVNSWTEHANMDGCWEDVEMP